MNHWWTDELHIFAAHQGPPRPGPRPGPRPCPRPCPRGVSPGVAVSFEELTEEDPSNGSNGSNGSGAFLAESKSKSTSSRNRNRQWSGKTRLDDFDFDKISISRWEGKRSWKEEKTFCELVKRVEVRSRNEEKVNTLLEVKEVEVKDKVKIRQRSRVKKVKTLFVSK